MARRPAPAGLLYVSAGSRGRAQRIAFVCSCETRDSVTPSTSPISLRVVVERHDELLALGEIADRLGQRLLDLGQLERDLGVGPSCCQRSIYPWLRSRARPRGQDL